MRGLLVCHIKIATHTHSLATTLDHQHMDRAAITHYQFILYPFVQVLVQKSICLNSMMNCLGDRV